MVARPGKLILIRTGTSRHDFESRSRRNNSATRLARERDRGSRALTSMGHTTASATEVGKVAYSDSRTHSRVGNVLAAELPPICAEIPESSGTGRDDKPDRKTFGAPEVATETDLRPGSRFTGGGHYVSGPGISFPQRCHETGASIAPGLSITGLSLPVPVGSKPDAKLFGVIPESLSRVSRFAPGNLWRPCSVCPGVRSMGEVSG